MFWNWLAEKLAITKTVHKACQIIIGGWDVSGPQISQSSTVNKNG